MRRVDAIVVFLVAGSLTAAAQAPSKPAADAGPKVSASQAAPGVVTQKQGDNVRTGALRADGGREVASKGTPREPQISFIDSPSVTCIQPDPAQDICYINWYYLSVDANPNYMIAMSVTLNTFGAVANIGGFFQTSMYVPYAQLGNGFKVQCGPPQAIDPAVGPCSPTPCTDPLPMGNAYAYTIKARDSSNLKSANYGTVYCPAYTP